MLLGRKHVCILLNPHVTAGALLAVKFDTRFISFLNCLAYQLGCSAAVPGFHIQLSQNSPALWRLLFPRKTFKQHVQKR